MINKTLVIVIMLILTSGCSGTMPNLGVNDNKLKPCPKTPNCVSSQAHDETHQIEPLRFEGDQKQAHERLMQIIESEKRTKIVTDEKDYIRVEFTSAVFRFVDDVEFYFPDGESDESIVHVRSASRLGSSDLGVNRKRIERIRKRFQG